MQESRARADKRTCRTRLAMETSPALYAAPVVGTYVDEVEGTCILRVKEERMCGKEEFQVFLPQLEGRLMRCCEE